MMDKTQNPWFVGLITATIQLPVFSNGSNYKSVEKKHKDDIVYTDQGSSTYNLSFNIDRQAYEITKKTTDAQKTSTKKAILNKDFRQAIMFAFNRKAYVAQTNGERVPIRLSVIPLRHQTLSKSMANNLVMQ